MEYRNRGAKILAGRGLEIGAMHQPLNVPDHCKVDYFDALTREEAIALFPEVPAEEFKIVPDFIGDLDKDGLRQIADSFFDFVIFNHVIEHIANPIKIVGELFRIVKKGGNVLISCPDKRFTFDRDRPLTPYSHLKKDYENEPSIVSDEHYLDFLSHVHPEVMSSPPEVLAQHLRSVRKRREHAHVWDSDSFRDFLENTFGLIAISASCVFEVTGDESHFEYFSIWQRDA